MAKKQKKIFISHQELSNMYDIYGNFMLASQLVPKIDKLAKYKTKLIKIEVDPYRLGVYFYVEKY